MPLWMPILGASMMALMMGGMMWMMWAMMRGGGHMDHKEPPPQPPADELSALRDEVARLRQKLEEMAPGGPDKTAPHHHAYEPSGEASTELGMATGAEEGDER